MSPLTKRTCRLNSEYGRPLARPVANTIRATAVKNPKHPPKPNQKIQSIDAIALPNPIGVQFNAFYRQFSRRTREPAR